MQNMGKLTLIGIATLGLLLTPRADAGDGLPPEMAGRILENLGAVAVPKGKDGARIKNLLTVMGQPAKAGTAATIRWDDQGLTVAFECEDKEVKSEKREHDAADIWKDDTVEVFLDLGRKRNTKNTSLVHVIVSAGGVAYDERGPVYYSKSSADPQNADRSWTLLGLKTSVEKTKTGWRAEIVMPWDGLGGKPAAGEVWGFNLARANWPEEEFQCLFPTLGPFYNSDRWTTLCFLEKPLADDPAVLGEIFKELRVRVAPKGPAGIAVGQFRTLTGAAAKTPTSANVRWDDEGLTIAFDCEDKEIKAEERKRDDADNIWKDDTVEVFLDVGNQRDPRSDRWWHLTLNAAGAVADERGPMQWYPKEGGGAIARRPATPKGGDGKQDLADLKTKVEKTKTGWRAEICLSWKALGAKPAAGEIWGFNLARNNWPEEDIQCLAPTIAFLHNIERWGYLLFTEAPLEIPPLPPLPRPAPRPGTPPAVGQNLVFNGDFKKGLEGWTTNRGVIHQTNDADVSEGKVLRAPTRGDCAIMLGNQQPTLLSQPFPLDPAFNYRFAMDMSARHWSAKIFTLGYRWQPGVKRHSGIPKDDELQLVWRSRPVVFEHRPAPNLVEQDFCYILGPWKRSGVDLPGADLSRFDTRVWNEVEFGRVEISAPLGGHNALYGYIFADDVAVERVE